MSSSIERRRFVVLLGGGLTALAAAGSWVMALAAPRRALAAAIPPDVLLRPENPLYLNGPASYGIVTIDGGYIVQKGFGTVEIGELIKVS